MSVIDTHCHLDIVASRGVATSDALSRARAAGVEAVVQIAVNLSSSQANFELATQAAGNNDFPEVYWTAGLHPESATEAETLPQLTDFIRAHRDHERFVAVGEVGLDYFHTQEFVEVQKRSLALLFDLAVELSLPVVLHLRDSQQYDPGATQSVSDALAMVQARPGLRGVLHCFTYGPREAEGFLKQDWKVSYSGIATFRNAHAVQEGARSLPLEHLMVETDAPFLAPVPQRGKINEPSFVVHTLDHIVKIRSEALGEDPDLIRQIIYRNSRDFIEWKHHL